MFLNSKYNLHIINDFSSVTSDDNASCIEFSPIETEIILTILESEKPTGSLVDELNLNAEELAIRKSVCLLPVSWKK